MASLVVKIKVTALLDQTIPISPSLPSKTAPSNPIDYLIPRPTTPSPTPSTVKVTPTIKMTDTNENEDVSMTSPTPTTQPSEEETPNNRSEESSED